MRLKIQRLVKNLIYINIIKEETGVEIIIYYFCATFGLPNGIKHRLLSKGFKVSEWLSGPVAQLNRALDYGSRGFRFES